MPRKKDYDEDAVSTRAMHLFWSNGSKSATARMLEEHNYIEMTFRQI